VSAKAINEAIRGSKDKAISYKKNYKTLALIGNIDESIMNLKQEIDNRFIFPQNCYIRLKNEPFIKLLYKDSRFQALIEIEKKKYENDLLKYGL